MWIFICNYIFNNNLGVNNGLKYLKTHKKSVFFSIRLFCFTNKILYYKVEKIQRNIIPITEFVNSVISVKSGV